MRMLEIWLTWERVMWWAMAVSDSFVFLLKFYVRIFTHLPEESLHWMFCRILAVGVVKGCVGVFIFWQSSVHRFFGL
jgi:hypothetical protein